jgi:phage terminase large subunit-like protein
LSSLASLFPQEVMSNDVLFQPTLTWSQQQIHDSDARFKVVACGRRFGKTYLGGTECLITAINGGRAWWIAPTFKMAEVGWRPMTSTAVQFPGVDIRIVDRMILFPGGGSVTVRSAEDPDKLRGDSLDLAVFDEAAYIKPDAWTHAVRPTLTDRHGKAIFFSTPRGRNYFWELYQKGISRKEGWQSWQFSTFDNPLMDPKEIQTSKELLPELIFRQEYLAEFIDDQGGVFRRVQEAAILQPQEPDPKRNYIAGVDVASSVDYTVVTVLDAESHDLVFMDRFNRVDYPVLIDRLAALHDKWRLTSMTIEANSIGRPVIDHMVERGLVVRSFTTTSATKQAIIQNLQSAFEHGNIRILNEPVLVGELLSFESKRNASGTFSYSAPDGMHDDCVMSLAIALDAVDSHSVILFMD